MVTLSKWGPSGKHGHTQTRISFDFPQAIVCDKKITNTHSDNKILIEKINGKLVRYHIGTFISLNFRLNR